MAIAERRRASATGGPQPWHWGRRHAITSLSSTAPKECSASMTSGTSSTPAAASLLRLLPGHVHPVPAAVAARRDRIQPRVPRRRAACPDQDELEQTQLDGRQPITIRAADRVGKSCATSARATARRAATPATCRSTAEPPEARLWPLRPSAHSERKTRRVLVSHCVMLDG
jgi:hypothetical protein